MRGATAREAQQRTDLSDAALDAAGAAICVVDLEGQVLRWNQAAVAVTGISADQIVGKRAFRETLLFPDDIDKWKLEFERISGGSAPRHFETRWKRHDGSPLSLICTCSAVRDSTARIRYIVCTIIHRLSQEILSDRAAELDDISRFLHNTVSQDLIALSFYVSELEAAAPEGSAKSRAVVTLDVIDRCCRNVRLISYMLAPPVLGETSLEESIEQYAGSVRDETGLATAVEIDPVPATLPPAVRLLFFAAVQMWVMRAVRSHPKPALSLRLGNRSGTIVLELEMVGVEVMLPALSVLPNGWAVIRELARALGGECVIGGNATRLSAKISLAG